MIYMFVLKWLVITNIHTRLYPLEVVHVYTYIAIIKKIDDC